MNIIKRMKAPTPVFFRKLRNTGAMLAAISGAVLAAKGLFIPMVYCIAGYIAVAGSVAVAVSQAAVKNEDDMTNKHRA